MWTELVVFCCFLLEIGSAKKNVLFIMSDDMRPEIGAYVGPDFPSRIHPHMVTPHLDKLASRSLLLERAYAQQSVCSPSRVSMLTARRPDTTHVYTIGPYFRIVGGNFVTLPQYFKNYGYRTLGMGKIFHPGTSSGDDDPPSWTEPYFHAPNLPLWNVRSSWEAVTKQERERWPLPDEQLAEHAASMLRQFASSRNERPFFMAVGFHKPHLPFVFPEEFLDMYPDTTIHRPDNPSAPYDMPPLAWSFYRELRSYKDVEKLHVTGDINTTLPTYKMLELRRAYYASISYIDSLVGFLLRVLEQTGLANNTIVSFIGDHGYHLGENGEWCKHTDFDVAVHVPMMVYVPGITDYGIRSQALVELVDLYPTLVEAAGLPELPLCPKNDSSEVNTCREGQSMMHLIWSDGDYEGSKDAVFFQINRAAIQGPQNLRYMGYSLRTRRYRYTEWTKFNYKSYTPDWDYIIGVELYDHNSDPGENYNVAWSRRYLDVREALRVKLRAGWRNAFVKK